MYRWVVFMHIAATFGFLLAHGVQAAVMLKFRVEADPERSLTLFNVLPRLRLVRLTTVLIVITGLIAGFMLNWWRQGWLWASLALLIVITVLMARYGSGYFGMIAGSAARAVEAGKRGPDMDAFNAARTAWHPIGMTVVGVGGFAVILWLMMFKPF
ncbi:MAG: hypothetical protein M5R40_21660 [Anaerolineae bacterium]|nr:hypothetical protein [Anaerolineae bacterium]